MTSPEGGVERGGGGGHLDDTATQLALVGSDLVERRLVVLHGWIPLPL